MTNASSSLTALARAKAAALDDCEFCEKKGLAILPVRAAIMHPDSGGPMLPADLLPADGDGGKKIPLRGSAAYTGRTLRNGFLYVYDERGMWEKYWITPFGYLMKVPVGVPLNGAYVEGREPCNKTGHREIAACITVKEPKSAGRIWVGYSVAEWTPRVLQLNQDEAYRSRHMRVFDVKKWMESRKAPHARSLDNVASIVAEYSTKSKVETFAFSPYGFNSRASTTDGLLHAATSLGPKPGAVLIIDDPAGIAAEIGARAIELHGGFMAVADRSRKLSVSTAILSLQAAVTDRAEMNEIAAGDELEQDGHYVPDGVGRMIYVANPPKLPDATPADLSRVSSKSWKKYEVDYDEPARAQWQNEFNQEYGRFSERTLHPLAVSHVQWMTSSQMRNHLDCTHDSASAEVGLVYARVLTACIQGTEQFKPCARLYERWLNGVISDDKNLVLRGIVLNLESNKKIFSESLKPDVMWKTVGWDSLIQAFNNSIDGVAKHAPEVIGKLLASLGGSITQALQSAVDGPVRQALVACGVVSGRPVVPVELTGSYKAYRASLIRQLLKSSGIKKASENAIQREVSLALRRLQIRGEPMSTVVRSKFLVMIDEEAIKGMPKGLSKSEQAKWLANSLHSAEEIERLNLSAWRERINVPQRVATAGKAIPFIGNMLAGLFQWAAYQKVSIDLAGSLKGDKLESQFRLGSAVIALGSTVADTIARAAGNLVETTLLKGRAAVLGMAETLLRGASKVLGIVAAGINAYWDGKNAVEAIQQRNYPLGVALGVSALSGVVAAALLVAGSVIGTIVATLIFISSSVIATFLQDDKIDKWLKRCYWGALDRKDRYKNLEEELDELKMATGA
ncbi:T6SS effector BTH_I2691 family protein [Burkholderia sp. AW33-5]